MTTYWWDDLSSSEIRQRLVYHGVPELYADWLVDRRDRLDAAAIINRRLAGDS